MIQLIQLLFYLLFAIISGSLAAWFFYFKLHSPASTTKTHLLLFTLRAITFSIVIFLLLNPRLVFERKIAQKPLLILAIDNSMSVKFLNTPEALSGYMQTVEREEAKLKKHFEVHRVIFGQRVCDTCSIDFSHTSTNFSELINYLKFSSVTNRPQAMIVATDGLFNAGETYDLTPLSVNYPVFAMVLADTVPKIDYWIAGIKYNSQVPRNSRFEVEFDLQRSTFEPIDVWLEVLRNDKLELSEKITFNQGQQRIKIPRRFLADQPGIQRFEVSLKTNLPDENEENNRSMFAVEVTETSERYLVLYGAPHPDIGIVRRALEQISWINVDVVHAADFSGNFSPYRAVIFSGLPNGDFALDRHVVEAQRKRISSLFLITSQTNLTILSQLNPGWQFSGQRKTDAAYTTINQSFDYFQIPALWPKILDIIPPLTVPFGRWNITNPNDIVFYQRIGDLTTQNPLLVVSNFAGRKAAAFIGEGLWRWNLHLNRTLGNASPLSDIILQIISYLSTKPTDKPFYLLVEPMWAKTEKPVIKGFVYNANNELVNDRRVDITLISAADNFVQTFEMLPVKDHYQVSPGFLPVGNYTVVGTYKTDSVIYTDKGSFFVTDINIEKLVSTPDIRRIENLVNNQDDNIFFPSDFNRLADKVIQNTQPKPQLSVVSEVTDIISLTLLFFILMATITFEWFLRKYHGYR